MDTHVQTTLEHAQAIINDATQRLSSLIAQHTEKTPGSASSNLKKPVLKALLAQSIAMIMQYAHDNQLKMANMMVVGKLANPEEGEEGEVILAERTIDSLLGNNDNMPTQEEEAILYIKNSLFDATQDALEELPEQFHEGLILLHALELLIAELLHQSANDPLTIAKIFTDNIYNRLEEMSATY